MNQDLNKMLQDLLRLLGNGSINKSNGKSMKFESFIGIDVSKLTLDLYVELHPERAYKVRIPNNWESLKTFFDEVSTCLDVNTTLICAEYTGHYSNILKGFCLQEGWCLWLENGAEIKYGSGVQREKDDSLDAFRIAQYARRFQDRAKPIKASHKSIEELQLLLTERELYVKECAKYKAQITDLKKFLNSQFYQERKNRLTRHRVSLEASITEIEQRITELLESDPLLADQLKILESIDGVGRQVAVNTIIETRGFTKFTNGRKFACHVGVAPFSFTSGTSQRSRNKVSHRANKRLKSLFHMAALSAIRVEGEFKEYFDRKVASGKNKMSVINAVRSKIINRMFALIRDHRLYEKNYAPSLVKP